MTRLLAVALDCIGWDSVLWEFNEVANCVYGRLLLVAGIDCTIGVFSSLFERGSMSFTTVEQVRRVFRVIAGFTLLLVGAVMVFTPGPGWLVILGGLTLLGAEFVWARRLMDRLKQEGNRVKETVLRFGKSEPRQE